MSCAAIVIVMIIIIIIIYAIYIAPFLKASKSALLVIMELAFISDLRNVS